MECDSIEEGTVGEVTTIRGLFRVLVDEAALLQVGYSADDNAVSLVGWLEFWVCEVIGPRFSWS